MLKEHLLTCTEVARQFQVDKETVRRWARSGKLPATKIGQAWLITEGGLSVFTEARDREAATDDN